MTLTSMLGGAKRWLHDLATQTDLLILAGTIAGAAIVGTGAHYQQKKQSEFRAVSFSEYSQLEDQAKAGIIEQNAVTQYYAGVNDFINKIFESYNADGVLEAPKNAFASGRSALFAYNLKRQTDPQIHDHRRNLADFGALIPQLAEQTLQEMRDLRQARVFATYLATRAANTWGYDFKEDGHMESSVSFDSDGDISIDTEYECDAYHYTWTYRPPDGAALALAFSEAQQKVPAIERHTVHTANKVQQQNEDAIRISFYRENKREPTQEEIVAWSHRFSTGSQYEQHIDNAIANWSRLVSNDRLGWQRMQPKARSVSITTDCVPADAPEGYTFTKAIPETVQNLAIQTDAIVESIQRTKQRVPYLMSLITERVARENGDVERDPQTAAQFATLNNSALDRIIVDTATAVHRDNFPGGLPQKDYSHVAVALLAMLGGLVGAGLGFVADRAIERSFGMVRDRYRSYY